MSDIPETTQTWVDYAVDAALTVPLYATFGTAAAILGVAELVRR